MAGTVLGTTWAADVVTRLAVRSSVWLTPMVIGRVLVSMDGAVGLKSKGIVSLGHCSCSDCCKACAVVSTGPNSFITEETRMRDNSGIISATADFKASLKPTKPHSLVSAIGS